MGTALACVLAVALAARVLALTVTLIVVLVIVLAGVPVGRLVVCSARKWHVYFCSICKNEPQNFS